MHILIVDDDAVDRQELRRILCSAQEPREIEEASSVEEALTLLNTCHFDVILLDYSLPGRDGMDLLKELRLKDVHQSSAILMISVSEDESIALMSLQAGAQDFLTKSDMNAPRLNRAIQHAQTRFKLEQKLRVSYDKIKRIAEVDSLTELANRYLFNQHLNDALLRHKDSTHHFALILLDLDHFKYINDYHGHSIGDKLLFQVAQRISACLRSNELPSRIGGDEFAILVEKLSTPADATLVATRILDAMKTPYQVDGLSINTGTSIGIAWQSDPLISANDIFKHADIALYQAKHQGRHQACFFHDELQTKFSHRYQLETQLRQAIELQQFVMHYQPIYTTSSQTIVGFEALIRWTQNSRIISPAEFIPIAEQSGLIHRIGQYVIAQSILQLSIWNSQIEQPLTMAINISAVQLNDDTLANFIKHCLHIHQIQPEQITIELTETALIGDRTNQTESIMALNRLGCRIALDDFGTGFSSISHLRQFPIHIVKIDRSLMPSSPKDHKAQALIQGLVLMLTALDLKMVAEGIETLEHVTLCQQLGIHNMQGYYLAKPNHADVISTFIG
ncbi:putative bifunctional diguanylate cyclase/phosphodiesterase [Celerinatantimonas yamalensis]|uniref:EAL domain-containing protein n=1 Tax=Celerinatantimonas yamalensis TaxID=559956 RepID=A0ABW9G8Z8_9GAMM